MTPRDEVRVQASQPSAGSLGTARPTIETGSGKVLASCAGGVKSPKKNNLLLFVRESMQQWRAFRGYFNFQLNDKKLRKRSAYFSTNITSRKISHSKKNLKNHLLKCKYGA
ncbi:hypothetical protein H5849_10355 [Klebsiella pneumoniae]|uniref:hypothetical protein n=1 Tax=Klebsiella pneumoniae TaxID=573 RepID=UPI001CF7050B|nr:hypothetical protein [Klebsiella pneumoniae]MCB3332859.1 hypothetical protein [Klebsiella pneumoniae]MDZ3291949.1 hypothetical protein [Klebsiella pneumoniae]UPF51231.1 hypothetical protein LMH58_04805 [Klebsiella pneumoniae subsp. pneumoniae]HBS1278336.1 hypothetical protein [Klebsiella pneumoniae]